MFSGGVMVGRFQVMALLQAARAKALGYPLDEAESFGLNRAIFYAAAKRGFKGGTGSKHPGEQHVLTERFGQAFPQAWEQALQIVEQVCLLSGLCFQSI